MLNNAFNFDLQSEVQERKCVISKINGDHFSLVGVTSGGKVFIYTPKGNDYDQETNIEFLNLNKDIESIQAAKFMYNYPKESLVLATENTVILYDVDTASEKFYKDISDGVTVVAFGSMSGFSQGILIVGGNCNLLGFNEDGEEVYWNVTSDTVSALCFTDIDQDQENELVVGTEDNEIRVFKNEDIIYEIKEAAIPRILARMNKQRFAFGLENGMVGVYYKKKKVWRAKSQLKPTGIVHSKFEKNDLGFRPLLVSRINGQIEVRNDQSGENLYKLQTNTPIMSLLKEDFRQDKTQQIIAVSKKGQVKGFTLNSEGAQKTVQEAGEQIQELQRKKQELLNKYNGLINNQGQESFDEENQLPENFKIKKQFQHNLNKNTVDLIVQCTQGGYIKSVLLQSEKIFENGQFFFTPERVTNLVNIPIKMNKNIQEELQVKIFVGNNPNAMYYQVFDFDIRVPKFANFVNISSFDKYQLQMPKSQLNISLNERIPRYLKWIKDSFIIDSRTLQDFEEAAVNKSNAQANQLQIYFTSLDNKNYFQLDVDSSQGQCLIYTDNIELAGEIVQDMCSFMNLTEVQSKGQFPVEMSQFKEVLENIEQFRQSKTNITGEIANSVSTVKTMIVKAEDSMQMLDMPYMRKYYNDVMGENRTLMTELTKRKQNQEILQNSLKQLNSMINKGSNLRLGQYKQKVTNLCRNAIKSNQLFQILNIIENGDSY
ncbi:WD40-repeat-containing domain [Pseudocohnilembus persalinus]|uniref:WD40-repeat-containing domain n=1 Tax=Pseudocohnilembus persalinus TaxID=266149 RepID=A0A0V0R9P2_PSEPJ|nr:WD40-repeat-containing domain [Pseudocohnilembus persalinus]|eukprot:KRX11170.1 WD40-repeat-containing domain [Pseudocohnilembus persalinus]